MSSRPRVCLVSASLENVFFTEILEAVGEALRGHGVELESSTDCFPPVEPGLAYLYIPHEFHALVDELAHPTPDQLRRTVAICTEQPGTHWFEIACQAAAGAGAAFDINRLGAQELQRRGVAARYLQIGYVPEWDHWQRQERERSVDLAFLGGYTEKRAEVLARCARVLDGRHSAIYLTETAVPHRAGSPYFLSYDRKWRLMADTKVLLNVHRDEFPYFEWHRVIGAILNGCVVLSERAVDVDPLEPGKHYVSARCEDVPAILGRLLEDPEQLAGMRAAAYDLVRSELPLSRAVEPVLAEIERLASVVPAAAAAASVPMPRPVAPRPLEWVAHSGHVGADLLPVRMALKHLVVGMRGLERRLNKLTASAEAGEDEIEQLGARIAAPEVSVLLTVHNFADHVGAALRSVALGEGVPLEVVAVDDASTDDSVAVVREVSRELPWLPITLIRRTHNGGLPAARNLALEHARADLVFVLDADNMVLPRGIAKLRDALEQHPEAAFAYGLIECFDEHGPLDVLSWMDWDPARLRHGNFVDAMALIRRPALLEVGGYALDPALYGWEDFAVWVAMADAGRHGIRVPDFVARYRRAAHSMLALTKIDISEAWAVLLRRYPSLAKADGFTPVIDAETQPLSA